MDNIIYTLIDANNVEAFVPLVLTIIPAKAVMMDITLNQIIAIHVWKIV